MVVGGDKLDYYNDAESPTVNLLETKVLFNNVIPDADKGSRFMSCDDFFLAPLMVEAEYTRIHIKYLPPDIIKYYNATSLFHSDYVYCKTNKGVCGFKQAVILAYNQLLTYFTDVGYRSIISITSMLEHISRPTKVCLCVDDIGIKYYSKDDADHLLQTLGKDYTYSTD